MDIFLILVSAYLIQTQALTSPSNGKEVIDKQAEVIVPARTIYNPHYWYPEMFPYAKPLSY